MIAIHHEEALRACATAEAFSVYTGVPLRLARQAVSAWQKYCRSSVGSRHRRTLFGQLKSALAEIDRHVAKYRKREEHFEKLEVIEADLPNPPVVDQRMKHPRARVLPADEALRIVRGSSGR